MATSLGWRECRIRVLGHQLDTWDMADNPWEELILLSVEERALQRRPGNVCWELEAQYVNKYFCLKTGIMQSPEEITWLLILVHCLYC